jgi:hypothetical protein
MSQAPFSKPDVNDVVSNSPVFKIRPSLNHWSGERLPKARGRRLFGLVIIALLLLGLQLTSCGNAANPPISSASPTSNSNSQPNTPSTTNGPSGSGSNSASTPTAGPTTGPTTGATATPTSGVTTTPTAVPTATPTSGVTITPTAVPTPDPSSFTVTNNGATYGFKGTAGQQATIDLNNDDTGDSVIHFKYGDPGSSNPPGPIDWSVSANQNWIELDPSSGSLKFGSTSQVNIAVTIPKGMAAGFYPKIGTITFHPDDTTCNCSSNYLTLTVVPPAPTVSSISPTSGPAAGGTNVTITGTGFTGATGVSFGGAAASNIIVDSDTQITATSPAGSGTVDVTVTTPNGTSATGGADQFTYT